MSALEQIINWASSDLPEWQQDAVRRLLAQEQLTEADKSELYLMLKHSHGLLTEEELASAPKPRSIGAGHASGAPKAKIQIVLKSLDAVQNVNAIPDGSYINFAHQGMTIIYGENGAGKSGYARIIRRACSAKDQGGSIQPNIHAGPSTAIASAKFKIGVAGEDDKEIFWKDDGSKIDLLMNIVFFDSKAARVIVDEENHVSFRPYGTHIFEPLVNLIKELREKLVLEKPLPQRPAYSEVLPETKSGKYIAAISDRTSVDELAVEIAWSDQDESNLTGVNTRLADIESPDKKSKERHLNSTIKLLQNLDDELSQIESKLSTNSLSSTKEAIDTVVVAEKAFELASREATVVEPLPGVGGGPWQFLYNAAKAYSTSDAYPKEIFPATGDGKLCVLCMQGLSKEASDRLNRFKAYMERTAKKNLEDAIRVMGDWARLVELIKFDKCTDDLALEIRDKNSATADSVTAYYEQAKGLVEKIRSALRDKNKSIIVDAQIAPRPTIDQVLELIKAELAELTKAVTPEELAELKAKKKELTSRKALSVHKEDLIKYVSVLQLAKKYEKAIEATNIVAVSARAKKIISESTTPALQHALRHELDALGANHLGLNTAPVRADGEILHKLTFTSAALPRKVQLTDILSEGEQRVVALAGFLSEQTVSGDSLPVVLDDPITSLDHKFRDRIAKRLVEEARSRQIIVFTHDIAFLVELEGWAAELGAVSVYPQTILRNGNVPGRSARGLPWHAMKVSDRIHLVGDRLSRIQPLYETDRESYNSQAADLFGSMREIWEALVEECLLYGVVSRHGAAVKTLKLSRVAVDTSDYKKIYFAMKHCSEWMRGHDKSKVLNIDRPTPTEIRAHIDELMAYQKAIGDRGKDLEKNRDASVALVIPTAVG